MVFKRQVAVALVAGSALLGAACGSDDSSGSSVPCLTVSDEMMDAIASGEEDGVGMRPIRAFAVRSPDFSQVYFFAMEFSATGVPNQVGVWASNGLERGEGMILSIDSFAKNFTVWPAGDSTQADIAPTDPSVARAKSCLG